MIIIKTYFTCTVSAVMTKVRIDMNSKPLKGIRTNLVDKLRYILAASAFKVGITAPTKISIVRNILTVFPFGDITGSFTSGTYKHSKSSCTYYRGR